MHQRTAATLVELQPRHDVEPDGNGALRRLQALAEWEAQEAERQEAYAGVACGMESVSATDGDGPQFVAYVPLPDQKEIEQRVRALEP